MWKIGNIEIKGKVVLAPMAGVTFLSYRKFMSQYKFDCYYTEMVSDMGLIYGNEETTRYITFGKDIFPTGVQLFGHDPKSMQKASEIAQKSNKNIAFFDINMGCPVPKVTNTGAGSALMKDPKLCGDIVRAIKEVTDLPVTAKIRLGWDNSSINFMEVIKELEDAGVDAIAIHARTRKELYTGKPHYDLLKDLRSKMKVPLIVSGNIYTLDDAINAIEITGADAVMLARGAVGNPFLANQINSYYETGERLMSPSVLEQCDECLRLGKLMVEEFGDSKAMRIYRGIAPAFFSGIPNAKIFKSKLASSLYTYDNLVEIINEIKESVSGD